jgi:hypothetical protein
MKESEDASRLLSQSYSRSASGTCLRVLHFAGHTATQGWSQDQYYSKDQLDRHDSGGLQLEL